jgi:acyl transferase domain-containing protein
MESYESFMKSLTSSGISSYQINHSLTYSNGVNGVHKTNGINGVNGLNGVSHSRSSTPDASNGIHLTNGSAKNHHDVSPARVIVLSAKDEQTCRAMSLNLQEYLKTKTVDDGHLFDRLVYTLGQKRTLFPWIATCSAGNTSELIQALEPEKLKPVRRRKEAPRLGFVFTGQGAQWYAMGRELIDAYPVFRDCLVEAEHYLKELGASWSILEELTRDESSSKVHDVALSTPLCVALQVALVRLLRSWGVVPTAVSSHSSGEMAAACASGALDLRSTMAIVLSRGELASEMSRLVDGPNKGGMMAVGLGREESQSYIKRVTAGKLVVACINSPVSTTISGDVSGLIELENLLKADNIFARRLRVDAAWHSHHVHGIAKPYKMFLEKHLGHDEGRNLDVVFSSPTTGGLIRSHEVLCDPKHWVDSLVSPVEFVSAFRAMCIDEDNSTTVDAVVEVGPHGALSGPIHDILATLPEFGHLESDDSSGNGTIPYLTCLVRKNNAVTTMQSLIVNLIRLGYPVNMEAINFPRGHDQKLSVLHDLPLYPWNHSLRHWSESRFNKDFRERSDLPHDLLGSLALGCSTLCPTWRNVIRASDLPWVRDHIVQGNIVYPGAGYICMAIEGASSWHHRQSGSTNNGISGYRLRNVEILHALIVPETSQGIELQLTLSLPNPKDISASGWQEFQICSVNNENLWTEHCRGQIKVELAQTTAQDLAKESPTTPLADYRLRIEPNDIYRSLRSAGIIHGPIFQNLKLIRASERQSISTIVVPDTAATMPNHHQRPHVIHPATLDTFFQAAYTALPGAGSRMHTLQIPKTIKHLWVSQQINSSPGHSFDAISSLCRADRQSFETNIVANDSCLSSSPVLLTIDGFVAQSIGSTSSADATVSNAREFIKPEWAPDISYPNIDFLNKHLRYPVNASEKEVLDDLRRLCVYFMQRALHELTPKDVAGLASHHAKFFNWMKIQVGLATDSGLLMNGHTSVDSVNGDKTALETKVQATSVNGEMVSRLGPHLASILKGEVAPLELMVEDGFLNRYYENALKLDRSTAQVKSLVQLISHKNPRAKILEIGAGTGGATTAALEALGKNDTPGGPRATSYEFTDLSSGFFEAAKEKFKDWDSIVSFKRLDIEHDPIPQGFEEGSYDLIMACQVLHATKSMDVTMAHVRKLLKPGGKLLLIETTQDQLDVQFAFGLLPGWWLSMTTP